MDIFLSRGVSLGKLPGDSDFEGRSRSVPWEKTVLKE